MEHSLSILFNHIKFKCMKNYFIQRRENRLKRSIENLRLQDGEPIVKKLHKSVLYEEEAYEVLRYYVNLSC